MEVDGSDGTNSGSPLKRPLSEVTRETKGYARKRALKACRTCRMRKTKCNNEKPVCGFCQSLGAVCAYDDTAHDISVLDPASQLIVERLDQVLQRLDHSEAQSSRTISNVLQRLDQISLNGDPGRVPIDPVFSAEIPGSVNSAPHDGNEELIMDENMSTPQCRTSPDAVLDWPIFENQYSWSIISDCLFRDGFNSPNFESEHRPILSAATNAVINEETIPRLVEAFLARVHIKCPVLDVGMARKFASDVAQEGLRWNGQSCLVLIMSALGCVARPFSELYDQNIIQEGKTSSTKLHASSLSLGKVYYEAACKRIGLLGASILATQCRFLCGVYEMYRLNPLKAWRWFCDASSTLYMYLRCENIYSRGDMSVIESSDAQRLEASIYWSAYKSMCELRTELPLSESILANIKYAHVLPTPPSNLDSGMDVVEAVSPLFDATPESFSKLQDMEISSDKMQEQAWFFYLTDIILSRLGTRVLLNLYDDTHLHWNIGNLNRMLRATDEFERQLDDWFVTLPEPIQFDDFDIRPNHELRFTVQFRALEIKSWLYRPFLYYTIHHCPHDHLSPRLQSLVLKAIDSSIHWILLRPVRHRHHGSWYVGRLVLSSALSIVAAVKAGLVSKIEKLSDWRAIIREAISAMEFWEDESPDFRKGREILEKLVEEIREE